MTHEDWIEAQEANVEQTQLMLGQWVRSLPRMAGNSIVGQIFPVTYRKDLSLLKVLNATNVPYKQEHVDRVIGDAAAAINKQRTMHHSKIPTLTMQSHLQDIIVLVLSKLQKSGPVDLKHPPPNSELKRFVDLHYTGKDVHATASVHPDPKQTIDQLALEFETVLGRLRRDVDEATMDRLSQRLGALTQTAAEVIDKDANLQKQWDDHISKFL